MNRIKRIFPLAALLAALLACNLPGSRFNGTQETAQIETMLPTAVEPQPEVNCLVGTWELSDISAYALAILPSELNESGEATFKGTSGAVRYTFQADNQFSVDAFEYTILYDVPYQIITLPLAVTIEGDAKGFYSLEGDRLTNDRISEDRLSVSAEVAGAQVVEPTNVSQFAPLFTPPYNTARYSCDAENLRLDMGRETELSRSIAFKRVNP